MNIKEYNYIWKQLQTAEDIDRLAEEGYDDELLLVLYTEKHVRDIKKNYYGVAARSKKLLREWKAGHSFDHLAKKYRFSPILMASIVLKEYGMSKREIKNALQNYNAVKNARIQKELQMAQERDLVYSHKGYEIQRKRGEEGEARIAKWLDEQGISYKTEKDLKGQGKTVDFLLNKPMEIEIDGEAKEIYWIESKGSFGDIKKVRRDYDAQLRPYTQLWGPGIVVYWFGFLEGMELWLQARDVYPVRKEWFN